MSAAATTTVIDALTAAGERRVAAAGADGWAPAEVFAATLAVLRADHADADDSDSPLEQITEVFGLDEIDTVLLWTAAVADLDASFGLAYAQLRGQAGSARLTVALALELVGVPTATAEAFDRLGAEAPLRRHHLIELSDAEPWLSRQLRVPDTVVSTLAGADPSDPNVAMASVDLVPIVSPQSVEIARAVENGVPLVWIRSAAGMSGASTAAGAFEQLGLESLAIDLRRHAGAQSLTDLAAAAVRDAGLSGRGLVVIGCEAAVEASDRSVFEVFEGAAVPVVAVGTKPWNPVWLPRHPMAVEAGPLPAEDRSTTWKASLGDVVDADPDLREALLGLRLSAEDIVEAGRYARVLATSRDEPLGAAVVREAARRIGGSGGTDNVRMISTPDRATRPTFDDLILPDQVTDSLRQLVSWARHRDVVAAEGVLGGRGRGIAALFTGNPGTGKTLAAHVISEELSIDLFQVDLSAIVDKYIGETEKNLEKVFQAAEALDVVLFFDEADALFGSRSDVKDARDRYANQEVAYLLQRMEHFDGITILSTNLRGNLDKAFSRRMSFIIQFPNPDAPTRRRLWDHHLAQLSLLDDADEVDVEYLATVVELAGGDIRNIVLGAAYDAASYGEPVGMRHIVAATLREYRKLGRVIPEHGFTRS